MGATPANGSIRSSFGMDLVRISAGPNLEGKSLKILFKSASNPEYTFNIKIWDHRATTGGAAEPVASKQTSPATPVIEIEQIDLEDLSAMELVITRTDTNENILEPGDYIVQVIVK